MPKTSNTEILTLPNATLDVARVAISCLFAIHAEQRGLAARLPTQCISDPNPYPMDTTRWLELPRTQKLVWVTGNSLFELRRSSRRVGVDLRSLFALLEQHEFNAAPMHWLAYFDELMTAIASYIQIDKQLEPLWVSFERHEPVSEGVFQRLGSDVAELSGKYNKLAADIHQYWREGDTPLLPSSLEETAASITAGSASASVPPLSVNQLSLSEIIADVDEEIEQFQSLLRVEINEIESVIKRAVVNVQWERNEAGLKAASESQLSSIPDIMHLSACKARVEELIVSSKTRRQVIKTAAHVNELKATLVFLMEEYQLYARWVAERVEIKNRVKAQDEIRYRTPIRLPKVPADEIIVADTKTSTPAVSESTYQHPATETSKADMKTAEPAQSEGTYQHPATDTSKAVLPLAPSAMSSSVPTASREFILGAGSAFIREIEQSVQDIDRLQRIIHAEIKRLDILIEKISGFIRRELTQDDAPNVKAVLAMEIEQLMLCKTQLEALITSGQTRKQIGLAYRAERENAKQNIGAIRAIQHDDPQVDGINHALKQKEEKNRRTLLEGNVCWIEENQAYEQCARARDQIDARVRSMLSASTKKVAPVSTREIVPPVVPASPELEKTERVVVSPEPAVVAGGAERVVENPEPTVVVMNGARVAAKLSRPPSRVNDNSNESDDESDEAMVDEDEGLLLAPISTGARQGALYTYCLQQREALDFKEMSVNELRHQTNASGSLTSLATSGILAELPEDESVLYHSASMDPAADALAGAHDRSAAIQKIACEACITKSDRVLMMMPTELDIEVLLRNMLAIYGPSSLDAGHAKEKSKQGSSFFSSRAVNDAPLKKLELLISDSTSPENIELMKRVLTRCDDLAACFQLVESEPSFNQVSQLTSCN